MDVDGSNIDSGNKPTIKTTYRMLKHLHDCRPPLNLTSFSAKTVAPDPFSTPLSVAPPLTQGSRERDEQLVQDLPTITGATTTVTCEQNRSNNRRRLPLSFDL
ncbi:unnamed protein product [Fusarium graminearum]|nr:unnamed protein product [Fusarium graminearum]CAG1994780.1 unnamed protein product [Fusarium graminearum]